VLYDTLVDLFGVDAQQGGRTRAANENPGSQNVSGIRILLVEDNEMNQQVATELLESAGASVKVANHGGEAVRILKEASQPPPFDVVLMDLQMPEMDGFTTTKVLRDDPRFQSLPIIAMTAHALVEERQLCLEAGMNDHLTKPIDPDALFATLARWATPRPAQATEPAAGIPAIAIHDLIPREIEGVDVKNGLKRVAGNKKLYRDLLMQFAAKHGDAGQKISAALESGDLKLAERMAHTVKGIAGNIGAMQVFSAAGRLEKALREQRTNASTVSAEFSALLKRCPTSRVFLFRRTLASNSM
jgi:CheY-like chemotaxis protein/HPt (histidine-containing phosphotransfer) domain-containing protein